ncbi:AAA family ATPase [Bradymonas sediminis]|uniref:Uncharacterized protein n=1 Tax=Bradymonas sediminis TaxID=1548548 RepID=A0A2Z4FQE1_9DELT|nr:AAA family ATPase [Bradymonas sediminis]AWV91005.1 hypothetical protein DN745_17395 [Bradymonas sediminis]TDP75254.1 EVE domain-containing protein [Bradymonas sediminis]
MSRLTSPHAQQVYAAAAQFIERGLRQDDSLFTPGHAIWTAENVESLHDYFVNNPIEGTELKFTEKLERQLSGAPDQTIQLMAEFLFVHLLIATKECIGGKSKRSMIQGVLSGMEAPIKIPADLRQALDNGVANPGMAFLIHRPFMIYYVLDFVRAWKKRDSTQKDRLLEDGWAFREFLFKIDRSKARTQRHALLHLVHPERFEAITSVKMKRDIARGLSPYIDDPSANIDRQLGQIRHNLSQERGEGFEAFWDPEILRLWKPEANPWHEVLKWAKRFYESGHFEARERDYKLKIAQHIQAAITAVRDERPGWSKTLRRAFGSPNNLTSWRAHDAFLNWCDTNPDTARLALLQLWDEEENLRERLLGFFERLPKQVISGPSGRLSIASFLLMGQDPARYAFYKYTVVWRAFEYVDYTKPEDKRVEADTYLHTLEFLDAFIEEIAAKGVELRDRLDAQGLLFMVTRASLSELEFLSDEERRAYAEFRGLKAIPRVWIFQANTNEYALSEKLQNQEVGDTDWWRVTRYRDEIAKDDVVLLWESGANAGVYAVGRLVTDPVQAQADGPADPSCTVDFELVNILDQPILRDTLKRDAQLKDLPIIRAPQGTNFRVSKEAFNRLLFLFPELLEGLDVEADPSKLEMAEPFATHFTDIDEANWTFDLMRHTAEQLGVRGKDDARFSLYKWERDSLEFGLFFGERKVMAIGWSGWSDERVKLALDCELASELGIPQTYLFASAEDEPQIGIYRMSIKQAKSLGAPLREASERALEQTRDKYAHWTRSKYRNDHIQPLFEALFDDPTRRFILLNGWQAAEEPNEAPVYRLEDALEDLFVSRDKFKVILELLSARKNIILQGPPGIGKTFICKRLAYALMGEKDESRVEMVQFHQSYTYEDFIQGYRPSEEGAGFHRANGVFFEFCERARQADPNIPYIFIIDEINRGNLSKIFGELMMSIEPDKRGREWGINLQYAQPGEAKFSVPENVHLIGMMNTADRSLALVDYALRRRFAFVDLKPKFNKKFEAFLAQQDVHKSVIEQIVTRLTRLNRDIAADKPELGEGFCVGHSYFCSARGAQDGEAWYRRVIEYDIAPLLREYWFDRPEQAEEKIRALLEAF